MARITSKEKSQQYRLKMKLNENRYKMYKEKDAKRKREQRMKKKEQVQMGVFTSDKLEEMKKRETIRKRLYRQRKKEELKLKNQQEEQSAFKSPQTFGKALKKIRSVLPKCPNKKKELLTKIVNVEFPKINHLYTTKKIEPWNKIGIEWQEKIIAFYQRDDISRQAPGKRDVVCIKSSSKEKEKVQKRHMTMTVKEAYSLFLSEHPDSKIKLTKFYEFRPKHILISSLMPHNICVCKYHANFNFIVSSINKEVSVFPKNSKELLASICCQIDNSDCMNGICRSCDSEIEFALMPLSADLETEIRWKSWQIHFQRHHIVEVSGTLKTALDELQDSLNKFKIHCFVKTVQERHFESEKQNLDERKFVLQIDFAENYSCINQDEIQSAHWSHKQVTLFTAVSWTKDQHHSFAVISDELSHDKFSVWFFLKQIIKWMKNCYPLLNHVSIFSDGCAAQFKNKYTLTNLCFMTEDYGVSGTWNFFATSHGKGAVDGVGGNLKRIAWEMVKSRKIIINNAKEFLNAVQNKTIINLIYVTSQQIQEKYEMLNSRWENARAIPGLQSCHFFGPTEDMRLQMGQTNQHNLQEGDVFRK